MRAATDRSRSLQNLDTVLCAVCCTESTQYAFSVDHRALAEMDYPSHLIADRPVQQPASPIGPTVRPQQLPQRSDAVQPLSPQSPLAQPLPARTLIGRPRDSRNQRRATLVREERYPRSRVKGDQVPVRRRNWAA